MIVYNVDRSFFPKKDDAEAYRRAERLSPASLHKIEVNSRDDLAALLNALCEPKPLTMKDERPEARIDVADPIPDFIPRFLRRASGQ